MSAVEGFSAGQQAAGWAKAASLEMSASELKPSSTMTDVWYLLRSRSVSMPLVERRHLQ